MASPRAEGDRRRRAGWFPERGKIVADRAAVCRASEGCCVSVHDAVAESRCRRDGGRAVRGRGCSRADRGSVGRKGARLGVLTSPRALSRSVFCGGFGGTAAAGG